MTGGIFELKQLEKLVMGDRIIKAELIGDKWLLQTRVDSAGREYQLLIKRVVDDETLQST